MRALQPNLKLRLASRQLSDKGRDKSKGRRTDWQAVSCLIWQDMSKG